MSILLPVKGSGQRSQGYRMVWSITELRQIGTVLQKEVLTHLASLHEMI